MKAVYTTDQFGRRALVTDDKALRLFADPYGAEQKAAQWVAVTPEQKEALLTAASKKKNVEYDPEQSARYGRPIWR